MGTDADTKTVFKRWPGSSSSAKHGDGRDFGKASLRTRLDIFELSFGHPEIVS
jgi:hypothetical protein